jgi:deoxycytidine triphosphate deaminase
MTKAQPEWISLPEKLNVHLYGKDTNIRAFTLLADGPIPAKIGAKVTFEVVGIERIVIEGRR